MKQSNESPTPLTDFPNASARLETILTRLEQRIEAASARQKMLQAPQEEMTRMLSQLADTEKENQQLRTRLEDVTRKQQALESHYSGIAQKLDRAILRLEHMRETEEIG